MRKKPCKFAVDNSGEVWECGVYHSTYCVEQHNDLNPDGSVNIVECMYDPDEEEEPTVEAVPLSWWHELKDFLKSWKDDPLETITTSVTVELVLNKMNFIEEKGTEDGNSTL